MEANDLNALRFAQLKSSRKSLSGDRFYRRESPVIQIKRSGYLLCAGAKTTPITVAAEVMAVSKGFPQRGTARVGWPG